MTVKASGHSGPPEQRSNGFRWFLEFYLLYATGKYETIPPILLLEEPGIYLHPNVQDDLKELIRDSVSVEQQVVYTTHLPGMYDFTRPENARGVRKTDENPSVTVIEDLYDPEKQRITWDVAMASLGISKPGLMLHPQNLLVEGPADWVYFLTFADLLVSEYPDLRPIANGVIHVRPCGGTSGMKATVPLFLQNPLKSVVVVDADPQGNGLKDHLVNKLGLPNEYVLDVFTIADVEPVSSALGDGEHEIEDLFGVESYAKLVSAETGKKISKSSFTGNSMLGAQAQRIMSEKHQTEFRKVMAAWKFRDLVRSGDAAWVTDSTKEHFAGILNRVAATFRESA